MGNQKSPGLTKRGGIWYIDKVFRGTRIRESTGTNEIVKAQEQLAKRIDEIRSRIVFGQRPDRKFRAAATKFLEENQHKESIDDDGRNLEALDPLIGDLWIRQVHMTALQPFIKKRREDGVKTNTINLALATVRRILNLAATEWRDEQGLTWLEHAPKIKLLPVRDKRPPYPLSPDEQSVFFKELPDHLRRMSLFKVNTGAREKEICGLKWSEEVQVPELNTSVFIVDGARVKNKQDRLLVLNQVARSVIDSVRGQDPVHVFVYIPPENTKKKLDIRLNKKPAPIKRMNNSAWKNARERAADKWEAEKGQPAPQGFRRVRVHDLKHTFGRRLRAAGVSYEDRQDLLGHMSSRITTHYSAPELSNLIASAERACADESRKFPSSTLLFRKTG